LRILLDDEKTHLPDGSVPDLIIRNYDAAMLLWICSDIDWTELYIDHDLGTEKTGYDFLCEIEKADQQGEDTPGKIVCVSNNGAGRLRMQLVIDKIYGGSY
jgi:hypothetical protein